ncbi:TPA: HlyD family secretion protein [Pluralibacter gergoviae]|uniref:Membrane protein n=1 Tax=Pluralibacter gergoviae TaxID=61647 RepID=A0A0J5LU79_PLUGE|nr:HlyD family secretion protein [Pluralibacter gergoviae]KMK13222.1 membrane protein [Pluralibacter gergoviae]KMK23423.1 membrane protein [Pluralibacter gergoviae]HDS1153440.1 HlyD family secretion protein [Pluralibacter gergoviae]
MSITLNKTMGLIITLLSVSLASILVVMFWHAYVIAPWTRDGRVSVHVIRIAPEVSGTVTSVAVEDNQFVRKGDVLYRLDAERFQLAIAQATAQVTACRETLQQKKEEATRRHGLEDIVPAESVRRAGRDVAIALAKQQLSQTTLDIAKLNLQRSVLYAPVDGFVNHLRLRKGDYATEGEPNITIVDKASFWITGYFEETKLRRIHQGDTAQIRLMGSREILRGHVVSIGRGIADDNDTKNDDGLPAVNPTFSWVRLAQRIPVHIAIDTLPNDVVLSAGMTASIEITPPGHIESSRGRVLRWLYAVM